MYRIYVLRTSDVRDRVYIYDDEMPYDKTRQVISPKLCMEINSAGSLEFSFTSNNIGYGLIHGLACEIGVEQNGRIIWYGRPISIDEDQWGVRTVHCEGALAYLLDGIYMKDSKDANQDAWIESVKHADQALWERGPQLYEGPYAIPHAILAQHTISRKIYGKEKQYRAYFGSVVKTGSSYAWSRPPIEFEDDDDAAWFASASVNSITEWYGKSYSELFFELLNANGYYAYARKSTKTMGAHIDAFENVNTICIRRTYRSNDRRKINFGENLVSISSNQLYDSVFSALYVTHTTVQGQQNTPLPTETVSGETHNNKVAYHTDQTIPGLFILDRYIERFGFIVKTIDLGAIPTETAAYSAALSYIDNIDYIANTDSNSSIDILQELTVSALDLGLTEPGYYGMIQVLDLVHVYSEPNRISAMCPLTKIEITLDEPQNSLYTLNGTSPTISGSSSSSTTFGGTAKDNYVHPKFQKHVMGLYKFSNTGEGHVDSAKEVTKKDIEALGFKDYVHPSFKAHGLGFYKIANTNEGHVSQVSAVTKEDIEALGVVDTNTTYTFSVDKLSDGTYSGFTLGVSDSDGNSSSYAYRMDGVYDVTNNAYESNAIVVLTQSYTGYFNQQPEAYPYSVRLVGKTSVFGGVYASLIGQHTQDGRIDRNDISLTVTTAPFKWVPDEDPDVIRRDLGNTQFNNSQVTVGDGAKENLIIASSAIVNGSHCFIGGLFNETGKYCNSSILYGDSLKSNASCQLVLGTCNEIDNGTESNKRGTYAFIIGNGSSANKRRNALAVDWNGNIWCEGDTISINAQVDANTTAITTLQNDTKNVLHTTGGTMTGTLDTATNKTEITVPSARSTSDIPTVVAGGIIEASGGMIDILPRCRSFVGSYKNTSNNTWYDVISVRHRNGYSDGDSGGDRRGMAIYSDLSATGNLRWNKQGDQGIWQGVRTLLDTVNYSTQMATQLTNEDLNDGAVNGICGQFYANADNKCKNTAVSGQPFFMLAIRIVLNAKMQVAFYPHNNSLYVRSYFGSDWTTWRKI